MKSNSQIQLSSRLHLGDVDGDKIDEIITIDGRHMYFYKPTFDFIPIFEYVFPFPVQRLIVGDFTNHGREHGRDQICVVLSDGSFQAFAISDDKKTLWWWFTQANFIAPQEHFIVGDFTGDGADDIMLYNPNVGSIKVFSRMHSGFFEPVVNFSLGNLSGDMRNKIILAGDFGQEAKRKDLIIIDQSTRQISRYDSVTDTAGNVTFWWAFTTKGHFFQTNDQIRIANLSGSTKDEIIIRIFDTGSYKLYKAEYSEDGGLTPITNVEIGQLPINRGVGKIISAKVRDSGFRRERGGTRRDDILLFDENTRQLIRTDARYDYGINKYTFWWAYTSDLLFEPSPATRSMPWAVILCRFKGMPEVPEIENFFRQAFTPGTGGLIEYWHDVSLGSIDISGSRLFGWVELDMRRADAGNKNRSILIDAAIAAARRDGLDPLTGFHSQIAVFTHEWSKDGAPPGAGWWTPEWAPFWIDGSSDGRRVSAPAPGSHNGTFLAHEIGHGFNIGHDLAANLGDHYGDPNCIMSAMTVHAFSHLMNTSFGPSLSFPQLMLHNMMYPRRVNHINNTWVNSLEGTTIFLAPINDRTANGSLGCILPIDRTSSWSYYLEYMRPTGWNRGIGHDKMVIRRIYNNMAVYLGEIEVPINMRDSKVFTENSGQVRFQVQKNQQDGRVIKITAVKIG